MGSSGSNAGKPRSGMVITQRRRIRARQLTQQIRELMLQGMTNQMTIAGMIGVSQPTVGKYMKRIFEGWLDYDIRTTRQLIRYRVEMLSLGAYEAFGAWEQSKQSGEATKTDEVEQRCGICNGEGKAKKAKNRKCKACGGSGKIMVENVVRTVTKQAGDPSLLRLYTDCVRGMARLEGLYVENPRNRKAQQHQHQHIHGTIDWDKVPAEKLLAVRRAHQRALESVDTMDVPSQSIEIEEED